MKHYCIDCGIKISKNATRCRNCYFKTRTGKNAPNWKGGKPKCKDCGKQLSNYGFKRCHSCLAKHTWKTSKKMQERNLRGKNNYWYGSHRTGKDNPNWKGGKPKCLDCGKRLNKYVNKRCKTCHHKFKIGKNNPNWRGGIAYEPYSPEFNKQLKEQIRKRDNYICQICSKSEIDNGRKLDCHHIDYNKKNNNEDNLISLCQSCHVKTNGKRKYWQIYFKKNKKKVKS